YDFTGSHGTISSIYNAAHGGSASGVIGGMKSFFPDLPLNSGFYRVVLLIQPEGTLINAQWPAATQGYIIVYEKIINPAYEIWLQLMPKRAMACTYNIEYLLSGGINCSRPEKTRFMYYDWLPGGWGGRNGKDGANTTTSPFGLGLNTQPIEAQERVHPLHIRE